MKDQSPGQSRVRRQHDRAFKDELIAQSLVPGASVAAIAMKGGVNANLLFKWRRDHLRAAAAPTTATLLPVCMIPEATAPSPAEPSTPDLPTVHRATRAGVIEIDVAGAQLRVRGAVDENLLCTVLRALRSSQ